MFLSDGYAFIHTLNEQCKFRMKFIIEELFGDRKVNSHNIGDGLRHELYRFIVDAAKKIVFENRLELLKYEKDVILLPDKMQRSLTTK